MGSGEGPFGPIFMGGMFTLLKVREGLASYAEDPGWYRHPPGTLARAVGEHQTRMPATPAAQWQEGAALAALSASTLPQGAFDVVRPAACGAIGRRGK
jgi:hypothetical protein